MAKITELEETHDSEKLSFLNYLRTVINYIIWILGELFVTLRNLFSKKKWDIRSEQPQEKQIVTRRVGNRIVKCCHDDRFCENFAFPDVASIRDALKLFAGQFQKVYFGSNESPQTPSDAYINHVMVMNLLRSPNSATCTQDSKYEGIMAELTRLQDNGDFDEFDKYSSALLDRYGKTRPDITTAVLIEQARCMLYQDKILQAKFLARKSLEFARNNACSGKYIARAHLVLSACYRRKGKLGKAKRSLDIALKNLVNTAYYEDWCRYYDACGSYFNGISDTVTLPGQKLLENAKDCFFKQLQAAEEETRKDLRNQKFYALLKMARTLLDANTIFGQQREIPANDVKKAGEYLDEIEREFGDDVPRGSHVQFIIIRVKQFYRQQRFSEAVVLLQKCIALATVKGYERDKALMEEGLKRLTYIAERKRSEIPYAEGQNNKLSANSEGESRLESFDSASDSIGVFDSELGDSS